MTAKFDLHKSMCVICKVIIFIALIYIRIMSEGQTISYLILGVESLFVFAFIIGVYSINAMIKNYKYICKKHSEYQGVLAYIKFGKYLMVAMVIVGIVQGILSQPYATYVLKNSQSAILLFICSGILITSIGTCLFLYFYHVIRFYTPILVSMIAWLLSGLVGILFVIPRFSKLGSEVALFLQNETFTSIYRSLSVFLIVLIGCSLSFIINVIFYVMYGAKYKNRLKNKETVKANKVRKNYSRVFQIGIRESGISLFLHSLVVIGLIMYLTMSVDADLYLLGEYMIVVEISIAIIVAICSYSLKNIEFRSLYYHKNKNTKAERKETIIGLRWALYIATLYTTIMIVIAPYIIKLFFADFASEFPLFVIGALTLPCMLLSSYFAKLNSGMKQEKLVAISCLSCIAMYMISVAILFKTNGATILSLALAKLMVMIIFTILNYMILERQITIVLKTIMFVFVPILVGVISGGIVFALNQAWDIYLGDLFTMIISSILISIFYFVGIVGVKSLKKSEIEAMPGGVVVKKIASALHLF